MTVLRFPDSPENFRTISKEKRKELAQVHTTALHSILMVAQEVLAKSSEELDALPEDGQFCIYLGLLQALDLTADIDAVLRASLNRIAPPKYSDSA